MVHPRIEIAKGYSKEIYSVFMFKTENNTTGYINRDYNAVLNMKTITESEINGTGRPKEFCREATPKKIKKVRKTKKTEAVTKPKMVRRAATVAKPKKLATNPHK